MIYRFKSRLAVQDKLKAFPAPVPGSDKEHFGPWITEYDDVLREIKPKKKIVDLFDKPKYKLFEAPFFEKAKYELALYFADKFVEADMPDLWGIQTYLIISERFRAVVEKLDDMEHQYLPITLVDKDWNVLESEQTYYWFNLRRFLSIECDPLAPKSELSYYPNPVEEDFVHTLKYDSDLVEKVEQYPLWRHYRQVGPVGRYSQARRTLYIGATFQAELFKNGAGRRDCFNDSLSCLFADYLRTVD